MPELTIDQAVQLAIERHQRGQLSEAQAIYQEVLAHQPRHFVALHMLGVIAGQQGEFGRAEALIQQSLNIFPGEGLCHSNLGKIYFDQRKFEASIRACREAIRLNPTLAEAHHNLGNAFYATDHVDDAMDSYRRAIELRPNYLKAYHNLANTLKDRGEIDAAVAALRKGLAITPVAESHSNLIFTMMFGRNVSGAELLEECRRWNQQYVAPFRAQRQSHDNPRDPHRQIRVGYVSGDFREHCQALFTLPLFQAHDHKAVHVTGYSDVRASDAVTAKLRTACDTWRDIAGMPDQQVADLIRADKIDVLVDLTMHMAGNRLLVFARRPAPIQICWLAYPGTTGVETIDYRITDIWLDPPPRDAISPSELDSLPPPDECYSEESIRLPETFWCYDPLSDEVVSALPALTNGHVTFGCLNNACKFTETMLSTWGKILSAVSHSRMILMAPEGVLRNRISALFQNQGVEKSRLDFVAFRPRPDYLRTYHQIDIALDTFPVNGHTTSLDALWMGVPVVTLVGTQPLGRAGLCQLMNLKLNDFAANSIESYIQIATSTAHNLKNLAETRQQLRNIMQSSPLMNAPQFAKHIETAYREMWRRWCAGNPPY